METQEGALGRQWRCRAASTVSLRQSLLLCAPRTVRAHIKGLHPVNFGDHFLMFCSLRPSGAFQGPPRLAKRPGMATGHKIREKEGTKHASTCGSGCNLLANTMQGVCLAERKNKTMQAGHWIRMDPPR
ncbi:hypothetical protein MRX96_032167 [Rhipicephalus microplus]